jgi:acetyltransferase-like isoleucine patch superfamily enzyme
VAVWLWLHGKVVAWVLSMRRNVHVSGKLVVYGMPLIDIKKGARLVIGNNVTLNSRNRGYHINMHSPVKLFADGPGAEIRIGDNTRIHGTCIHATRSITVGRNCLIAGNCQLMDGSGHDLSFSSVENRINTKGISKPIVIEDNVWIGANSIILPGVRIGNGSVIAAGSIVTRDIPPMVVAGGNPARVIKTREQIDA